MGRKHVIPEYIQIESGDMSADIDTLANKVTTVDGVDRAIYRAEWSGGDGSTAGELKIQASKDKNTWWDLPVEPSISISGASGSAHIHISEITWKYMRATYSRSGGAGTLNVSLVCTTGGA